MSLVNSKKVLGDRKGGKQMIKVWGLRNDWIKMK
jgi:hypothetical protein